MKKVIASMIIIICLLVAFGVPVIIDWLYANFDNLPMDEIIFHFKVPVLGANTDIVEQGVKECLWKTIIPTAIMSIVLIYPMVRNIKIKHLIKTAEKRRTVFISTSIAILILIVSLSYILITTDVGEYIKNQINTSNLIENEYIAPEEVCIEFPEQKRNLIYIFLESMETTYCSKQDGGLSENDLIPEISKLAKENIDFSNAEEIGGAHVLTGTSWTVGAMTAETAGVPLKMSIDQNALGDYQIFLGGAYSIGQILEGNGYNNFLLLGSSATFGGRGSLFTQHGNYEIWDFYSAKTRRKSERKNLVGIYG